MAGELELRASDADRESVVGLLRDHAVAGRLTLEELSGRIESAYTSRTLGELERLTADLPAEAGAVPRSRRRPVRWTVALIGEAVRSGRWRVAPRTRVVLGIGSCKLDLRQAEIADEEVTITIFHGIGDTLVTVPEGVEVELSGLMLIGNKREVGSDTPARAGAPFVRVRLIGLIGDAEVRRC